MTAVPEPDIVPALGPEEWRQQLTRRPESKVARAGDYSHVLAALALHEHPAGFGWPDHDMLVDLAVASEQQAQLSEGEAATGDSRDTVLWTTDAAANRRRAEGLRSLAGRIAALLAPR